MYDLKEKTVLVTGGANGIGAALAIEVLKEGAKHVRILDINETAGIKFQNDLNNKFGLSKTKFVKCDVTDQKQFLKAIDDTKNEEGYLDVLVNNAGVTNEKDYAAIRKLIEINYIALVHGTLRAIELMDKSKGGRGGTVINISSISGLCPVVPPMFTYSSSKSAVLQFTSCIGDKSFFDTNGVRVVALCFGTTDTSIFSKINLFGNIEPGVSNLFDSYQFQSVESTAKGTVVAYKRGKSGSIWIVKDDQAALDITEDVEKCHEVMMKLIHS